MSILNDRSDKSHEALGLVAGIACFTTWGLIPIYWKLIASVPATEILANRFVWTTIFLSSILSWQKRWPELFAIVRSRRALIYCLTGGLAIASNWFLFIYAVNIGHVGWWLSILLVSTGVVPALPLFWFGYATRHLRLITVGFLQYLSPIGSFFLGVFLYHETFTHGHLITFVLIWLALIIFSAEAVLRWRSSRVREIDTCAFEASALD